MPTLNPPYAERMVATPPGRAKFLYTHWNKLGASLKLQGVAVHNAVVDLDFTFQPTTTDAEQQVDTALLEQLDGGATEAEVWARANALHPLMLNHYNDANYAHTYADATAAGLMVSAAATSTGTCTTRLLEMKAAHNGHALNEVGHNELGPVQLTVSITPTNAATNLTMLNELIRLLKRHLLSAFTDSTGRWV